MISHKNNQQKSEFTSKSWETIFPKDGIQWCRTLADTPVFFVSTGSKSNPHTSGNSPHSRAVTFTMGASHTVISSATQVLKWSETEAQTLLFAHICTCHWRLPGASQKCATKL